MHLNVLGRGLDLTDRNTEYAYVMERDPTWKILARVNNMLKIAIYLSVYIFSYYPLLLFSNT